MLYDRFEDVLPEVTSKLKEIFTHGFGSVTIKIETAKGGRRDMEIVACTSELRKIPDLKRPPD